MSTFAHFLFSQYFDYYIQLHAPSDVARPHLPVYTKTQITILLM